MDIATDERARLLAALDKFISQRSGIDTREYFEKWSDKDGVQAFYDDYKPILRNGRDARTMLAAIRRRDISADELAKALRDSWGGRLTWDGGRLDYCVGQYFPTEYRAAACAGLSLALRRYWRENGSDVQKTARDEFGRGIAARWFN